MIVLKKGKRIEKIPMLARETLSNAMKPMLAQTIHLAEEIGDDERDSFLAANPTVIPVFKVDVTAIVNKYVAEDASRVVQEDVE